MILIYQDHYYIDENGDFSVASFRNASVPYQTIPDVPHWHTGSDRANQITGVNFHQVDNLYEDSITAEIIQRYTPENVYKMYIEGMIEKSATNEYTSDILTKPELPNL